MEDTIEIKSTYNKDDLECVACRESLTKNIYQCANGPHYLCGFCNSQLQKKECPICKHPGNMIRNIKFEEENSK
jgi:hypothetical protein